MLILTRKLNESIIIGNDIEIKIVEIKRDGVKIGIKAPKHINIVRKELLDIVKKENTLAKINNTNIKNLLKK